VERRDGPQSVCVLWRGEMCHSQCVCCGEERCATVSVCAVERRDGPQSVYVLWRGEMCHSQYVCCGEERCATVSVCAVERRDVPQSVYVLWRGENSPAMPGLGPQIACCRAHRLFEYRTKCLYGRMLMFLTVCFNSILLPFITGYSDVG
jgi:hypothetical protein